jgi:tetratricopeptide (TPR) repeat protein
MKRILAISSLFFSFVLIFATDNESYDNANAAYKDGNFNQAIEGYETLLTEGISSEIYYNLANAYFKTGQFPEAILNYERALKLAPNDKDILYNLRIANLQLKDKIQAKPAFFLLTWWQQFAQLQTANFWTILFLIFLWASISLLLFFAFSNQSFRVFLFYGGFSALLLAILFLLLTLTRHHSETKTNAAIIMATSIAVKSEPQSTGKDLFILHSGLKVKVVGEESDWFNIRLEDGKEGWVKMEALEKI